MNILSCRKRRFQRSPRKIRGCLNDVSVHYSDIFGFLLLWTRPIFSLGNSFRSVLLKWDNLDCFREWVTLTIYWNGVLRVLRFAMLSETEQGRQNLTDIYDLPIGNDRHRGDEYAFPRSCPPSSLVLNWRPSCRIRPESMRCFIH